jgi:hypothetical protein
MDKTNINIKMVFLGLYLLLFCIYLIWVNWVGLIITAFFIILFVWGLYND